MSGVFRFADFELRAQQRLLLRQGQPLQTGGRAMDLLVLLVEQRHRTVGKAELIDHCWPNQAVEPNNLAVQMWALRRLLGPQAIATVPGRGYRFVLPLADESPSPPAPAPQSSPTAPASASAAALPLLAPMFGRDRELAQLLGLLQTHRLVTLLGPPGVGKTRLAQAAVAVLAAQRQRTLLVDLATVTSGSRVEDAVRRALGQVDRGAVSTLPEPWRGLLDGAPLLLVLDNCEHLAADVSALAASMLAQTAGLMLLATSQQPLKLPAEQQLRLGPLPVGDGGASDSPALQLLLSRVQSLDAGFVLTAEARQLALDLCRRLDGLPLAIELAAVRVPALGLRGVLARLPDSLHLLTRGASLQRHATLADALAWSVSLLDPPLQTLFGTLGVFSGSFGVELALSVGTAGGLDEWAVLDGIGRLIEHSLLVAEPLAETPRLRLLETVRAHALQRLQAAGDLPRLRRLHAHAVCRLLAHNGLEREAGRLSSDAALAAVRLELDNARAAMDWVLSAPAGSDTPGPDGAAARAAIGHSILADAWPAMMFLGLHHEALRWMTALRPRLDTSTPPRTAGFLLLGLGKIGVVTHTLEPGRRHAALLQARDLLDTLQRTEYPMAVRQTLAQSACQLGNPAEALARIDEALAMLQRGDMAGYRADLIVWRGIALALLGRHAEAEAAHAEALPLCVPEGNGDWIFMLMCDLAELEALLGLHEAAAGRWRFLATAAGARGVHSPVQAPLWAGLQGSLVALGDTAGARAAASEVWRHMAVRGCPLEGCHFHAALLALEGRHEAAGWLLGAGDRQWREAGERRLLSEAAARSSAVDVLRQAADPLALERWRRHGHTLTPAEVGEVLFGA
jgi:predicted ATPase/DNA-binding winged helix-turn-helix (wHTH) protein